MKRDGNEGVKKKFNYERVTNNNHAHSFAHTATFFFTVRVDFESSMKQQKRAIRLDLHNIARTMPPY